MRLSILFFLLVISHSSYTQELLTEIAAQGKIDNISGMMIDADIFITIDVLSPNGKKSSKSYLIQKDGSKSEIDLTAIVGKYLIGGVRDGENTYFYYIDEKNDRVLIEAMRTDNKTGKGVVLSNSMDVPGKKGAAIIKRLFGYLLIVDSLSGAEKFLTVGHYGDHMIAVIGPASVAGLIVTAASLIVREVAEGPISTVYSYYRGSMDKGFTASYKSPFVRKVMDDYEYRQLISGVRYDYRGYLDLPGATCAIYQKDKSKTIQILRFKNLKSE
jgi:hypothetical protein